MTNGYDDIDALVGRLRRRANDPGGSTDMEGDSLCPPATEELVRRSEARLGFSLPPLLRRLFMEVGNGSFGPAYGLLGLPGGAVQEDGHDCVAQYEAYRATDPDDRYWQWPDKLVPLGHLGCAMFVCVDCSKDAGAVIWFEPNPHVHGEPWDDSFIPLADSLQAWLTAWLDGKESGLYELAWKTKFGT